MFQLLTQYLFQNKTCPLPGLGTLSVITKPAETDFTNKQILAPLPSIQFTREEKSSAALTSFIASQQHCSITDAEQQLNEYCHSLVKKISDTGTLSLPGVGTFTSGAAGALNFSAIELPANLVQPVPAERVIHTEASHSMLVGDKETTSTAMTEYYSDEPVKKDRWWIWAIILGLISAAVIALYLSSDSSNNQFGNSINVLNQ